MKEHPREAIELLRRFYETNLTGDTPDRELWIAYCQDERLLEYQPSVGGNVLTVTNLGSLAVKLQAPDDYPAEFRDGGQPDGEPLTCPYLEDPNNIDWLLKKSYVSNAYKKGLLTKRVKPAGKPYAYDYKELMALRNLKTKNEPQEH